MTNRQFALTRLPESALLADHFRLEQSVRPTPADGEVLVRTLYIALDAASRAWMQGATYRDGLVAGDVMAGMALAEVVESRAAHLEAGDLVFAETGWREFAAIPAEGLNTLPRVEPLTHLLSVYGVPGLTAYFGLLECGRPVAGETVLVSAAAGAVGSFAGQIAKLRGCRVVGVAGGGAKCALITQEFGFDAAVDYKAGNLESDLRAACPEGIHVYFDNTGGDVLQASLPLMARHGRIVCCGAVSQYNAAAPGPGPYGVPGLLIIHSLVMQGFLLADYRDRHEAAIGELRAWVESGQMVVREDVVEGFDSLPTALVGLLAGENIGKRMVKVA